MLSDIVKSAALKAIALGVKPPEAQMDRVIELVHLKRLLFDLGINCVIDVGANRGQFAAELRAIGYAGRIVSFEPLRGEFKRMAQHFASDSDWSGHQIALGSEERVMEINIPRLTVLSSLLQPIQSGPGVTTDQVDVKRLDALLPALVKGIDAPRIFLKMDTQGFDLEVFKGASGCVADILGIQSELSVQPLYVGMPHYLEALAAYEQAGFDLYNLSVVTRTPAGGLVEMNCFMKRRA